MRTKKWIAELLAAVMCCTLITVPVSAYERVDTEQKASLSLQYRDTERDQAISGLEMRLYKVADMSDSVRFTLTEDFADASVFRDESFDLEALNAEKWAALADTLTAYVAAQRAQDDSITPAASGTTDEEGKLTFTELDVGLYLLEGDKAVDGNYTYTPAHYLMTLLMLNTETDAWEYDVLGGNKYTRRYDSGGGGDKDNDGEKISRNVMKVWEDRDDAAKVRPESITVQLLCDGEVYDTVTLSAENHWKHSWVGLDADADWQLVESDVPDGYTVLVGQEGTTFVVTNTYRDDDHDDNDDEELDDGDVPTGGKDGGDDDELLDEDIPLGGLPQTGVLWWPVQLLTLVGITLFALGWADGRKKGSEDA